MSTTLSVRFLLGRYHATPWDRSVNEGAVEWPPSPWRLLRALVSTWHTRWPELPAADVEALLGALASPPSYWVAPSRPGHTRHYLPDASHRTGVSGSTDLALDPFLMLSPQDSPHLLIRWDVDLSTEQRELLAKLAELVPYLGRAESVCELTLLDPSAAVSPDETWWRPHANGTEHQRLLAPTSPVRLSALEVTTVAVRKAKRLLPESTVWVPYGRTPKDEPPARPAQPSGGLVQAIRFGLHSRAPFLATHGVLLADMMHRAVTKRLDGGRPELLGHAGAATDHRHAHWVPLTASREPGAVLDGLLVWAPGGIQPAEVATIIGTRQLSGRRGGDDGYEVKGFPKTTLLLQAVGPVDQVAPELCGPSRVWVSQTPYLPVRHHKRSRGSYEDFLADDLRRELRYRGVDVPVQVELIPNRERWTMGYRRHRLDEVLSRDSRVGHAVRLTFDSTVEGPLMLGQLSHFGFGVFVPASP
jgi:CRISPR-associated protein Csb2